MVVTFVVEVVKVISCSEECYGQVWWRMLWSCHVVGNVVVMLLLWCRQSWSCHVMENVMVMSCFGDC